MDAETTTLNRKKDHELTLPLAKCCECCHPRLYPQELQCLWWLDSECQAEERKMHGCHFIISHCDNHNVCTQSFRGESLTQKCSWDRYAMSDCLCKNVYVKPNNNKIWYITTLMWLEIKKLCSSPHTDEYIKYPNSYFLMQSLFLETFYAVHIYQCPLCFHIWEPGERRKTPQKLLLRVCDFKPFSSYELWPL